MILILVKFIEWPGENCVSLNLRGCLGFRVMKDFNSALLAKQGWRLLHKEDSLVSKVIKGRYYPRTSFLQAKFGK